MKFQKLTIHHIASIKDAVIDFEAEPLADSEVFLITGKTGAGKSTILDAICLALFADTPRLYSTQMQGVTIDAKKEVQIDDPRQLMRRNTTEAHVILTFLGSNGIPYEATWAVARSYKKLSGSIKSKTWELKNLNTGQSLTKDAEIKSEIKAAVGLDFNQFCRTTMLAQGEFTRFLNSKDNEKAEILEKITGVDIYSKIGAKVHELTTRKKQEWEEAKQRMEGIHILSDTEKEQKAQQVAELDAQQKELKAASDQARIMHDWLLRHARLTQEVADAAANLRQATERVESEAFTERDSIVREWHDTTDARLWMSEAEKATEVQVRLQKELEELASEFAMLLGGQLCAEQKAREIAGEMEAITKWLDDEKGKATVYENAQTIAGLLTTISEGRQAIARCNREIAKESRALHEVLEPTLERARQEAKITQKAFEREEAAIMQQEETVAALHLQELRRQHDAAKELSTRIATAKERIENLKRVQEQRATVHRQLAERQEAIKGKKLQSAAMEAPLHDAAIRLNTRKEDLDKQKETIHQFASALRLKLHPGDTCPVCRQRIETELPHEEELSALVEGLQSAYEVAEKEHGDLLQAKTRLDAEIQTESQAYQRDLNAFESDHSVALAEAKAEDACRACGIESLSDSTLSVLCTLELSTQTQKERLAHQIREGEAQEAAIRQLRQLLDARRREMEAKATKVQRAEKEVSDSLHQIHMAHTLAGTKKNDVESADLKVREQIAGIRWDIDWHEAPDAFSLTLQQAAKRYQANRELQQQLTVRLHTARTDLQNVASVIEAIWAAIPAWREKEVPHPSPAGNLPDRANSILNKVTVTLAQLQSAATNYQTNHSQLEAFLSAHPSLTAERLTNLRTYTSTDIALQESELKKERDAVVARQSLLDNANRVLHEQEQQKPTWTEEATPESLQKEMKGYETLVEKLGEQKGSIHQELRIDTENRQKLGTLIQEADAQKNIYQKWSRLDDLIGDVTGSTFRKIAQSYVLSSLIHSANSYMKTLTDRYTLKVSPGTFVISLEDAYQGFVSRAASTLSGGESFLVSLSLALALSDIGQQWQVDTLFIDEGFGTLSGEPLQKAIETLRSLHSKSGRHVGIISHVEELQERIAVQIQVNQEGNHSSSSIRIVPSPPCEV